MKAGGDRPPLSDSDLIVHFAGREGITTKAWLRVDGSRFAPRTLQREHQTLITSRLQDLVLCVCVLYPLSATCPHLELSELIKKMPHVLNTQTKRTIPN